jgi:hypothetical protein
MLAKNLISLGLAVGLVSCAGTKPSPGESKKPAVLLDADVAGQTAWVAYAMALGAYEDGRDSFETELKARDSMIQVWVELKQQGKESATDPYLEEMIGVRDAGYLREYVWTFHRRPVWGALP